MLLVLALSPLLLWYLYAVVMALVSARDRYSGTLPWPIRALGYPALGVGLAIDLLVNVTLCTLIFLELPRELTVSGRLWRISNAESSWRQRTALWLRVNLLDPLDPSGIHKG
jgi:hypothetical protein